MWVTHVALKDENDVATMTLLLTAANVQVNLDILDVSRQLLSVASKHLEMFTEYKNMMERVNAQQLP